MGLQCFECGIDSGHSCVTNGTQAGSKVTCKIGENACRKTVGGKKGLFITLDFDFSIKGWT